MKKVVAALALAAGVVAVHGSADATNDHQITICHATGNPGHYSMPSPTKQQISENGGHKNGNENAVHVGDIIPPFADGSHGGQQWSAFDGQNWDEEGRAIYDNGCKVPVDVDESTTTTSTTSTTVRDTTIPTTDERAIVVVPAPAADAVQAERLPYTG